MVRNKKLTHNKRQGGHHKKSSKHYQKPYWPYIVTCLLFVGIGSIIHSSPASTSTETQNQSVLAYATEISSGNLLLYTNTQRQSNGAQNLSINSQLTQAAQAKANDMVSRDYWSHNTPDGQTPWTFVAASGYSYQKAGENLAFGFSSSSETITGWMNSPPHRQALLDSEYRDVGFGIANSANFTDNGPQTIVVAMYGNPVVVTPPPPPTPPTPTQNTTPVSVAPTPVSDEQASTPQPSTTLPEPEATKTEPPKQDEPYTTDSGVEKEGDSVKITLAQRLTRGKIPWISGALTATAFILFILWFARHSRNFRNKIKHGEDFIQHHPLIDIAVLAIIVLVYVLTRVIGFVR